MNAKLNPNELTQLLNQSTQSLDSHTLSALQRARQRALSRQLMPEAAFALSTGHWTHKMLPHSTQQWFATAALVAALVISAGYWQHNQEQQIRELDVAILTDELPIEVFVD